MARQYLPNGKIRVCITVGVKPNGKPYRPSKTCVTEEEAAAYEAKLLELKANGGYSLDLTFNEYLRDFFWPAKRHLRHNTKRGYLRDIDLRLSPAFGNMRLKDIKRAHVQRLIDSCPTRKTATNACETLSCILTLAVEDELIPRNPAGGRSFRYPDTVRIHGKDGVWITRYAEHKQLLALAEEHAGGQPLEYVVILGLCFGLRPGEIFGLDWAGVDFERREICITQTFTCGAKKPDPPKTQNGYRTIPMNTYAYEKLKALYDSYPPGERPVSVVARPEDGGRFRPPTARAQMAAFRRNEGVPAVTMATLRHSFATAAINSGAEIKKVSRMLGHSDIYVTINRYVKPSQDDLRAEMLMLDEAFRNA